MVGAMEGSASVSASVRVPPGPPHQLHFIIAIKTLSSRPREAVLLCAQSAATWTCTVIITSGDVFCEATLVRERRVSVMRAKR